ncbi:non-ribosomal peptide synthetase [Paenibacillus methanolicus]|uniref:HAD superfamily phosphatase (TIGR01681 family)/FkbH-like protein/amino acid adenylation domain-containing protein n=1 Tax=Paenibacillus methanolicus TaxID=582686 RepID=A0A5S5CLQ3_9BACL|nr:non-ribosomal peptide synthetase [Paenibacillus methanolicus]TYP79318.1 HAD superfamily phosphatase (TIGR01681 family)/FkbH-like protein/amino acid adenylation domain-containing protein [Paenibacillus methanolicus]
MQQTAWWEEDDVPFEPEEASVNAEPSGVMEEDSGRDIAIIGMAAHLPGAEDVRQFWERLMSAYDAVGPFPDSRRGDAASMLAGTKLPKGKVSYYDGAYLDEIDRFDHRFFRISPKEAALMSPNQRLWLETAWSAIEDAGYGGRRLQGSRTGVYVGYNGDAFHDYKRLIAERDPAALSTAIPGNLSSIVAGRLSYLLDLKGPAMTVDTACSSSLLALHLALQALRGGECEMALVGGVKTYLLPVDMGIRIGIESIDFRARTFDESSDGTGGGEGAGAVLLKPLGRALRDRDAIYAVIKGSAANQDGASVGITAPNVLAQEEVIARAWQDAAIDPETVGYIEAHGTGTRLGDPIEIAGMTQAFRRYTDRRQFCAVGSVKTNFGHLDTAAGIIGLIKTALSLHRGTLPPMLHFREPNQAIPFADSPVYVNDLPREWHRQDGQPRRAGISSFGMSGTNVHAVLEEAPAAEHSLVEEPEGAGGDSLRVLTLSAKSEAALRRLAERYVRLLEEEDPGRIRLRDLCYTANTGRGHYDYRAAIAADSIGELADKLRSLAEALAAAQASGEGEFACRSMAPGVWIGRPDGAEAAAYTEEDMMALTSEQLCRAYASGVSWDWEPLYRESDCRRVHLPAYPFERTRCWVEESAGDGDYLLPLDWADADYASDHSAPSAAGEPERAPVRLTGRSSVNYSATERLVADAWARVLGFAEIGVRDHYYELGGDSILALQIAERLSGRLGRQIQVAELLGYPTIETLSAHLDESNRLASAASSAAINDAEAEETTAESNAGSASESASVAAGIEHPLSRSQLRLFLASQQSDADLRFHMPLAYVIDGPMDAERLRAAFIRLATRHESLRTTFGWSDEGEPVQLVHPHPVVDVEQTQSAAEADWADCAAAFIRPFDVSRLPLFRVGIATASPERHLMLLDTHHLIADGASLALLLQELTVLYSGRALPSAAADYRDYVNWQREQADSSSMLRQRAYWLEEALAGTLPQLRLPLDRPRPKTRTGQGKTYRFTMEAETAESLRELAKRRQASLHTVLFSLYALLLNRYTGQDDLIIGSLVNGREQAEFRRTIGLFINFLPVRIRAREEMTLAELMEEVGRKTAEAYAHGEFPYDEMAAAVDAGANRSRNPLYDAMLVYHNHAAGSERFEAGGLTFSEYPLERHSSALDVKLDLFPGADGTLRGVIEYDSTLFREETVARMAGHYCHLASLAPTAADTPLNRIELFESEEAAELESRRQFNDETAADPMRRLAVRVASTFTAEPIAKPLQHWLSSFGYAPEVTFAPYNQIFQQLLADANTEQRPAGGATVVLVRPEDWLAAGIEPEEGLTLLEDDFERLFTLLGNRLDQGPQLVAIMPFDRNGPLRGMEQEAAQAWYGRVLTLAAASPDVRLLDMANSAVRYRVRDIEDPVAFEEGRIPYTDSYFAAIGTEVARALVGWHGHPFKVIVVDADHTLWRGVIGEDGASGLAVSPPFAAFQRLLLRKRSEGHLLALCSKNNEADLWEAFDQHPDMVLRKEHFAAWRVNWQPKSANIRELAEELNLGLDSFLFVDDNAAECLAMMSACPEVLTLKLPEEREIPAFLEHVWAWDRLRVTEEDRMRATGYDAERKRRSAANAGETLEKYLQSLELKVGMRPIETEEMERAAQLTARTNQFNLNGIRRTEADIRGYLQTDSSRVWMVEAADRYGEYGRIGLVAADIQGEALVLRQFLLSCRVLGRGVEQAVSAGLKRIAIENGCTELRAAFRPTAKNIPFERFLTEAGWKSFGAPMNGEDAIENLSSADGFAASCYILLSDVPDVPAHIEFSEGVRLGADEAYSETAAANGGQRQGTALAAAKRSAAPESTLDEAVRAAINADEDNPFSEQPYDWVVPYEYEALLLHRAYALPLRYADAAAIASIPSLEASNAGGHAKLPYEPPVNETEAGLAELWAKLLNGGPYSRNDHFFDCGGNSLQAASLVSRVVRTFGVRLSMMDLFEHARLKQMAELVANSRETSASSGEAAKIRTAPEAESYVVSSAQRRMYFLQQFDPASTAYNIPTVLRLDGALDRSRLRMAFRQLAERHEALRTCFAMRNGEPHQLIYSEAVVDIEERETSGDEPLREAIRAFVRPFDLDRGPLFRAGLFSASDREQTLVFDIHHIVADGVSVNVLLDDFMALYAGRELPPLKLHYKDYAAWQREVQGSGGYEEALDGWLRRFEGSIPKLELPVDRTRPAVRSQQGAQLVIKLGKEQAHAIARLAQQAGATPFMVLLAAYAAWLMRLSRQTELVIGTPVAGRSLPETERMVGVFVNPLPMRLTVEPGQTFGQLLASVKEEVLQALDRQDAPFEELVDRLGMARDTSRSPLYDAMFSMLNMAHGDLSAAAMRVEPVPFDFGVSQFDIGLSAIEEEDGLTLTVQYATGIFLTETMRHWADAFLTIMNGVVRDPGAKLADIDLMTDEEREVVVEKFNATQAPFPDELTVPDIYRVQAERTPDRIAAVFDDGESLTYRELDARAKQVALALLEGGLSPEEPVGLMAERSSAMLAGMLGILMAGGAYVPLPPSFPADRLRYMAEDYGLCVVCAQREWLPLAEQAAPDAQRIDLDDARLREAASLTPSSVEAGLAKPEGLAYILYTSGSTGRPKGVMIRHRSVVNRLNWMQRAYPLGAGDVILQKTPYSFDVSVWELFWWMQAGASVAFLPPDAEKDPAAIAEAIAKHGITTMHFVPSMLAAFLEAMQHEPPAELRERLGTLKRVFASGEALHRSHVDRFYALFRSLGLTDAKLINLYGPTEATVDVTVHECEAESELDFVPIGRPIDNTSLYVIGEGGLAQPIGVPGELCIAGVQVAAGYVNRPGLTAEKFVPHPYAPGEVIYRTGDLARWMTDGQLQYLGRIDDQVKIRGYRIELGEIERTLLLHEAISEAVVTVRDDGRGGQRLVGYAVADRACSASELRKHCGERLPSYMIPEAFVQLEAMPLTASGKADRKSLPEPELEPSPGTAYVAPRTKKEAKLAVLWAALLDRERVGAEDNFFELGGHSLKAAALTAAIQSQFGIRLPLKAVFQHPTVRELSAYMQAGSMEAAPASIPRAEPKPYYPATSAQVQMLLDDNRSPESLLYHIPTALELRGRLDTDKLSAALGKLIERHEALRLTFAQAEGVISQVVHERIDTPLEMIAPADFFGSDTSENEADAALRWLKPFDTANGPLFRVCVVPRGEDRHLLLFDIHHAVSDGTSIALLLSELISLYEDRVLPPVRAQITDYSEWLARSLTAEERERKRAYWLNRFEEAVPALAWPTPKGREALADPSTRAEVGRHRFTLTGERYEALIRLAQDAGATLSMALFAAYQALLGHWCATGDVVTGVPTAGRSHPDLARTAGLLLQTLAIRNRPRPALAFADWLSEVKESMLQAFDHAGLTTEEMIELLDDRGRIRPDPTRHPLFDTMFVMQNMDIPPARSGDLSWETLDYRFTGAKLDLVLEAAERGGGLDLVFEYRSRLFPEEMIARMAENVLEMLEHAAAEPQATLGALTGTLPSVVPVVAKLAPAPMAAKEDVDVAGLFAEDFSF